MKRNFAWEIKKGTGYVIIHLQNSNESKYQKTIERAFLKNLSYDPQCEEDRSKYLLDISKILGKTSEFTNLVLANILSPKEKYYDVRQMFAYLCEATYDGVVDLKDHLLKIHYLLNQDINNHSLGDEWLIKLFGLVGFTQILDISEKLTQYHGDQYSVSKYYLENCVKLIGDDAKDFLFKSKGKYQYIRAPLMDYIECSGKEMENTRTKYDYDKFQDLLLKGRRYIGPFMAKELSPEDFERICSDFCKHDVKGLPPAYFSLFSEREYLGDPKDFLPFLKSSDIKVVAQALRALKKIRSKWVREQCELRLRDPELFLDALEGMIACMTPDDISLLTSKIRKMKTTEDLHWHIHVGLEILEERPDLVSPDFLETFYLFCHCGICRQKFVEVIFKEDARLDYIREETQWDCDLVTRNIYNESFKSARVG